MAEYQCDWNGHKRKTSALNYWIKWIIINEEPSKLVNQIDQMHIAAYFYRLNRKQQIITIHHSEWIESKWNEIIEMPTQDDDFQSKFSILSNTIECSVHCTLCVEFNVFVTTFLIQFKWWWENENFEIFSSSRLFLLSNFDFHYENHCITW